MTRLLPTVLCGALALLAGLDYRHFANGQERALGLLETHQMEARHPELAAQVGRHYDPVFAQLRVARALLEDELDRSWMAGMPADRQRLEAERGMVRLQEARGLAQVSWPRRPSSWEAALVLGGATYLELYRGRDARLMSSSELWEEPLLAAHRLGPSETGPIRFLAAAYLGNWSSLTAEQRAAAADLLAQGFQDRRTYRLLIRDWLRVAPSRRQALEPVPDRPWAWEALEQIFSDSRDHELEVLARRRRHESLLRDQQRVIADARAALRRGEERQARYILLTLLDELPRSLGFAPALEEILALLPPGPTGPQHAATFASWLDWTFELCLLNECPFPAPALTRLTLLAGDLLPEQRALAFLVAGDLPQAQLVERRFDQTSTDGWAAYFLLKAEHLARLGRAAEASESLGKLPQAWQRRPRYWIAYREIASPAADSSNEARSNEALARLSRSNWDPTDWQRRDSAARLEVMASAPAAGLRLEIVDAPAHGVIFDVLWDGEWVATHRTVGSRAELDLDLPVAAGLHQLEVVFRSGGSARPAAVSLI